MMAFGRSLYTFDIEVLSSAALTPFDVEKS